MIALVITIIVLLILAGISISMLSGDNSILKRATDSKKNTEESQIIENVRIDSSSKITENKGNGLSKKQLKDVLKKYFNEEEVGNLEIPDDVSTSNEELTTKDGKYKIKLSDIYNGKVENRWEYNHDLQTVENDKLTLKIGDYVNTTPYTVDGKQFDGKWRVLGEENGQVLLVSANNVNFQGSYEVSGIYVIQLKGSNGIDNEIVRLNTISAKFADGTKTEKGRSIKVEDINKITGYNPKESRLDKNDLTKKGVYGKDTINQYGNTVTYSIKSDGKVWYKGDQVFKTETQSNETQFRTPGTSNNITNSFTIKSTGYNYYVQTLGTFKPSDVASGQNMEGLSIDSPAYNMLFGPQLSWAYWMASEDVFVKDGYVRWGLMAAGKSSSGASVSIQWLWNSNGWESTLGVGLRPVVSLKSNITPNFVSKDESTGISTYEI